MFNFLHKGIGTPNSVNLLKRAMQTVIYYFIMEEIVPTIEFYYYIILGYFNTKYFKSLFMYNKVSFVRRLHILYCSHIDYKQTIKNKVQTLNFE